MKRPELRELAERLVAFGRSCGADEIEVAASDGVEFHVDVRRGRVENLVQAGSRVLGLRVIKDRRTASASSSDLDRRTLERLVRNAVKRAALGGADPCSGLAPLAENRNDPEVLGLYDPEVPALDAAAKIRLALETERIALLDKRITNSHGASFSTDEARTVLANSNGFVGEYAQTFCGLGVSLQAGTTDNRVEDSWATSRRHVGDLETPEEVARRAVARTVRQLRPRKIGTRTVPVVFEPDQTAWLLGFLFSCITGTAVYQRATFLADSLGKRIGRDNLTVVDDGLVVRGLGTRPFDSDGVPTRRTIVVDRGVLKTFLCNTYAARKLGLQATGNAEGGGVGPGNFWLLPGKRTPAEIVSGLKEGFILIRTLGHGLNSVSGDISRGAFGLWVEDGEIVHPVSEVTISGNLGEALKNIDAVGSDLEVHGEIAGPTVLVNGLTIAGS